MPTDKSKKESGISGTHSAVTDDLIEVKFEYGDGPTKGIVARDFRSDRKKIVFLQNGGHSVLTDLDRRRPLTGERWLCRVIRDTEPKKPRHGIFYVELVEPRQLVLPLTTGDCLYVPMQTICRLGGAASEVLRLLPEVSRKVIVPSRSRESAQTIDLGRIVGYDTRVSAPEVGYDIPTLFAQRAARAKPSRILQSSVMRGASVSTLSIWFGEMSSGNWQLHDAVFGALAPREPWNYRHDPERFDRAMTYWSAHAFLYDPATMGPIVSATWREVIERRVRFPGEREHAA